MYIHERKDWPNLTWDSAKITPLLIDVRYLQGRLLGRMDELGFQLCKEANLQTLIQDVLKTSEIEGEKLDIEQVRSSLAKRLGLERGAALSVDRNVEGIVDILLDATRHYHQPLTKERLFVWHSSLFPTHSNMIRRMVVGKWRTKASGPMQVVSGPPGREKIHYEAPGYHRLNQEMTRFLTWFNARSETDGVLQSAVAHFWFVTIHPFVDGNGRIARAIADMLLARSEKNSQRFYSMSAQIQRERKTYYEMLESCQKSSSDITLWIEWFLNCLKRAILASETTLGNVLTKANFWKTYQTESFNERQRTIINRLLDQFEGKLTSSKWAKINKCSQDTALRDINDLLERGILKKASEGGRSTSYSLCC